MPPRQGQAKAGKDTRALGLEKTQLCRGGCRECGHTAAPRPGCGSLSPADPARPSGPRLTPSLCISSLSQGIQKLNCKHSPVETVPV